MTTNAFPNTLNAAPFRPFTIHPADGRSIPLIHPDFVLVTGIERTAIISRPEDNCFAIADVFQISQWKVPSNLASVS